MRDSLANPPGAAWRVFGVTTLAVFMVSLDATVVVAVFPALRQSFATSPDWLLSWILNAYTIVYAALLVPAGRWVDRWGHSQSFSAGLIVFTAASALCGLATRADVLIAARILQAVGAALLTPAALALTLEAFPPNQRSFVVGLWSACGALAAAAGPAAGSWLVDLTSWSMIFWINVPVGLLGCIFVGWVLPRAGETRSGAAPDWVGSGILMAGVAIVCIGIVRSAEVAWTASLGTVLFGLGLLALFVVWVRHHPIASRDFSILKNRTVAQANLATFVFGAAFGMMFLSFFFLMTGVWNFSQSRAGLAAMPGPLLVIPAAVWAGRLATRLGQRSLLIAGGLLFGGAHGWYFLRVSDQPEYFTTWLPGQLAVGFAIGLVLPSLTSLALSGLEAEHLGLGSAVNSALRQIGGAVGVAISIALIAHAGLTLSTFRIIYLLLILGGLSVAMMAWRLDDRRFGLPIKKAKNFFKKSRKWAISIDFNLSTACRCSHHTPIKI